MEQLYVLIYSEETGAVRYQDIILVQEDSLQEVSDTLHAYVKLLSAGGEQHDYLIASWQDDVQERLEEADAVMVVSTFDGTLVQVVDIRLENRTREEFLAEVEEVYADFVLSYFWKEGQ